MWGPGFADPLNDPFGIFVEEAKSTFVLAFLFTDVCGCLAGILVCAGTPALLAGVDLNEEAFAAQLVPQ
jgi:hypothetical protein